MKVIAIHGSPRKESTSAFLGGKIIELAQKRGAETREYFLGKMKYDGCIACQGCKKKSAFCVVSDDLSAALNDIPEADVIIFTSPIYFGDISGQFKCFFDRTYSFLNPDFSIRFKAGKKSVFILAQGDSNRENFQDVYPRYQKWLDLFGFKENYLIRILGVRDPSALEKREDLIKQAEEIAKTLVK